jgi:fatty-acyl-CoA synthase
VPEVAAPVDAALPFGEWIHAAAARHGAKPALQAADGSCDYSELARRVGALAGSLAAAGVGRGDFVAWLGTNSAAMVATLAAAARLGAVFVPLNWRQAPPELRAQLAAVEPGVLVADTEFVDACAGQRLAPARTLCIARGGGAPPAGWIGWDLFAARGAPHGAGESIDPDAPALLCFTSGSTGAPKGVLLSARALAANADAAVDMHGLTCDDRVLTALPLFHVGGLNIQTLPAIRCGCSVTLHARFDPDATFDAIERERITVTVLVPAQLDVLLAHPRWPTADLGSLRLIASGSTVVARRLIDAVHARGVPLIQVWGATETGPVVCCLRAEEARGHAGSAGRAALGAELRIADVDGSTLPCGRSGEVLVRGPQLMNGYWGDAGATERALADGWFHSGDAGHLDSDGYLWIDGRLKDLIICGGENVSPAEVEAALLESPEVAEAAVVGRPDARWGEVVVAFVVPAAGAQVDATRLIAGLAGRLARFKQPRDLFVVDALPRTALGKVRKEALRQRFAAQHQGQPA